MGKFSSRLFKPTFRVRARLLVNGRLQWPILQRTAFYTFTCALYFMVVLFYSEWSRISHDSLSSTLIQFLDVVLCWAPGVMLIAPIIVYDVLLFTNRVAGPMYRIRREMERLIDGQSEQPIVLREDDWTEMANLFNQIQTEVLQLRASAEEKSETVLGTSTSEESTSEESQPEESKPEEELLAAAE